MHRPLISVIVATCNYGRYIRKAIDSVLGQTYPRVELIVVDDGSTDETAELVRLYPSVKYVYHSNRGVSASRNRGIGLASGEYLCFLDADDWLQENGLEDNYHGIAAFPGAAFVSGNYILLDAGTGDRKEIISSVSGNKYAELLKCNYIGMLAAVLFQKWALLECQFDESLKACEDYDLFLRLARRYPVIETSKCIATYFHHSFSLSHNYPLMIDSIQAVIKRQEDCLSGSEERQAFEIGMNQWTEYDGLVDQDNQPEI